MASREGNVVLLQDEDIAAPQLNIQSDQNEGTNFPPEGIPHIEENNHQQIAMMEIMEPPLSRPRAIDIKLVQNGGHCWKIISIIIWSLIFILLVLYAILWFIGRCSTHSYHHYEFLRYIWFTPYFVILYLICIVVIISSIKTFTLAPTIFAAVWVFSIFVIFISLMFWVDLSIWPGVIVWLFILIIQCVYAYKVCLCKFCFT